jgi:Caspase domain
MSSRTHVFAVAVEEYQDGAIPGVGFAVGDADRFVAAWRGLGVAAEDGVVLCGAGATYMAILSRLKGFLAQVAAGDRVVFYYAGHGVDFAGQGHLTSFDTQSGDGEGTSIPLRQILGMLGKARSGQTVLFLDAWHGASFAEGEAFSAVEVREFCEASPTRAGFAACGVGERAHGSPALREGLWQHGLGRALRGEAPGVLAKGSRLIAPGLQKFLADEVTRLLRETQAGAAVQTPGAFGTLEPEFVVAEVGEIVAAQSAKGSVAGFSLRDAYLTGRKGGTLRSLSGFKKGQFIPEGRTGRADAFVKGIGKAEVREQAIAIRDALKEEFGYKLKDLQFADGDGVVTLKTPAFDVDVAIEIDADDASAYAITTKVSVFRDPAMVGDERFGGIFSPSCDTVILESAQPIAIAALISQIEEEAALARHLDYPPEGDAFTLAFPQERLRLEADARRITIRREGPGGLAAQLESIQRMLAALGGAGIALLP